MTLKNGDSFSSNGFGDFIVIDYMSARKVKVKFLTTGYEVVTSANSIRMGMVKDKLLPTVQGVGCIGDGNYASKSGSKHAKEYLTWKGMLQRCYDEKQRHKNINYAGCTVCDEWLNYQVFAEWYHSNHPKDGHTYELDKDIKNPGNKIYSPDNCKFVSKKENIQESVHRKKNLKSFSLIDPNGNLHEGKNLDKFCREHGLTRNSINRLETGTRKHHKGWKLARINQG